MVEQNKKESLQPQRLSTALSDAQSIIEAAERRAEEIKAEAEANFEKITKEAYEEGFLQGLKDASKKALRLIIDIGAIKEKIATEAASLALAICSNIIGEQVKIDSSVAKNIAASALKDAVVGDKVSLIVNPEDVGALSSAMPMFSRIAGGAVVSIEGDETITRGGCLLRTNFGEIDATVESLLKSIGQHLNIDEYEL